MMSRILSITLAGLAAAFAVAAVQTGEQHLPVLIAALGALAVTLATAFIPALRASLGGALRALRERASLFWLLILIEVCVWIGGWVVPWQPTSGRAAHPAEYAYLLTGLWLLLTLLFFGATPDHARAVAARLGRSKLTGALVTLTTVVILFWGIEAYLRIFYVTTDAFGFTAMNYHWYRNFGWGQDNSLGFRDREPKPDAPDRIRVGILGDSFAMGHGINDLNATFGQLLEDALPANYDVNIIAKSGWDTDVQLYELDHYPLRPDIVVLSYYLNDIDFQLTGTDANPDAAFDFPDSPILNWFVLNFFGPNYVYYNLIQFTSPQRTGDFLSDLLGAYDDEALWGRQAQLLYEIVLWARDHNVRLIALLWPHLTAVESSQPALERLRAFFAEQGVTVVDMTDAVRANLGNPALIVNNFDTHPGPLAQRLAAEALYAAIMGRE
jgi:hypothetical protein